MQCELLGVLECAFSALGKTRADVEGPLATAQPDENGAGTAGRALCALQLELRGQRATRVENRGSA